jgi:hypothetical protein
LGIDARKIASTRGSGSVAVGREADARGGEAVLHVGEDPLDEDAAVAASAPAVLTKTRRCDDGAAVRALSRQVHHEAPWSWKYGCGSAEAVGASRTPARMPAARRVRRMGAGSGTPRSIAA